MPFEGTRRAFWSTVFGLRPLFAAACILRPRPKPASLSHQSREAFCAAMRVMTPGHSFMASRRLQPVRPVASVAFLLPCASWHGPHLCVPRRLQPIRSVASTGTCSPARHGLTPRRLEPQHTPCAHYSTFSSDGRYIPHAEKTLRSQNKALSFQPYSLGTHLGRRIRAI